MNWTRSRKPIRPKSQSSTFNQIKKSLHGGLNLNRKEKDKITADIFKNLITPSKLQDTGLNAKPAEDSKYVQEQAINLLHSDITTEAEEKANEAAVAEFGPLKMDQSLFDHISMTESRESVELSSDLQAVERTNSLRTRMATIEYRLDLLQECIQNLTNLVSKEE